MMINKYLLEDTAKSVQTHAEGIIVGDPVLDQSTPFSWIKATFWRKEIANYIKGYIYIYI